MKIKFNLEGQDQAAAFFALYAGLRMYKEQKINTSNEQISIPATEASVMLLELKEQFPNEYKEAVEEFDSIYGESFNIKNDYQKGFEDGIDSSVEKIHRKLEHERELESSRKIKTWK